MLVTGRALLREWFELVNHLRPRRARGWGRWARVPWPGWAWPCIWVSGGGRVRHFVLLPAAPVVSLARPAGELLARPASSCWKEDAAHSALCLHAPPSLSAQLLPGILTPRGMTWGQKSNSCPLGPLPPSARQPAHRLAADSPCPREPAPVSCPSPSPCCHSDWGRLSWHSARPSPGQHRTPSFQTPVSGLAWGRSRGATPPPTSSGRVP